MNEKIKKIAVFDGWELIPSTDYMVRETKTSRESLHKSNLPYLTDLNALHRVALDVVDELRVILNSSEDHNSNAFHAFHRIRCECCSRPINGQYTYLVDAVYDAIVYLKNNEK